MYKVAISVIGMDEEEMLKRITGLLEQGCTMLATHHSCGAPLFRCRGQVVCPVCSFGEECAAEDRALEMKEGSSGSDQNKSAQEEEMPLVEAPMDKARSDIARSEIDNTLAHEGLRKGLREGLSIEEADLRSAILRKLKELTAGIEQEQDLDKLRKQFDCIEAALKALRSMER